MVNPNAMDLDKNSDTLTLNDEFTYDYKESNPVEFNLNEVKVYRYDSASGTKGEELDSSDYTATPTSSASGDKRVNGLTITVPDSTALLVEYSYKVVGQQNATVQVSNNVTMKGKTSGVSGQSVKVAESHGDAQITKMSFYKADSKDPSNRLEGAFFDLYKWDGTDWVRLCKGLRTDIRAQSHSPLQRTAEIRNVRKTRMRFAVSPRPLSDSTRHTSSLKPKPLKVTSRLPAMMRFTTSCSGTRPPSLLSR